MSIEFIKMQSLGNDFIIFENINSIKNIINICDRNIGIGCDQLMIINHLNDRINLKIFNQDGSIADMCGNGLRCVAGLYFNRNPHQSKVIINIGPKNNEFLVEKIDQKLVSVSFSYPILKNNIVEIGNLHKIIHLKNIDKTKSDLEIIKTISNSSDKKISDEYNINYVSYINNKAYIVTIEKGVGETNACGSGSIASIFWGNKNGFLTNQNTEVINFGTIKTGKKLYVKNINNKYNLIGGYEFVFSGKLMDLII